MHPTKFYRTNSQRPSNEEETKILEKRNASTIGRSQGRSYTHIHTEGFIPLRIQENHEKGLINQKEDSIEKLKSELNKCTGKLTQVHEKVEAGKLNSRKIKSYQRKEKKLNKKIQKIRGKIEKALQDIKNSNQNIEFEKHRLPESLNLEDFARDINSLDPALTSQPHPTDSKE